MEKVQESLDDKMKAYESKFTKETVDCDLPICVRLDGKGFSKFTKSLKRPFDERLSQIMINVMNHLVEKTGATIGYTQSDEITLLFLNTTGTDEMSFNGKIQKLTSTYAAMTSVKFNKELEKSIPEKSEDLPIFDARIWNVPTIKEALDVILWRMRDARKNSISMACHAHIHHKKTLTKNSIERVQMLQDMGIIWSNYPEYFKTGTLAIKTLKKFDKIPEEYAQYHQNSEQSFFRTEIRNINMPELLENYSEKSLILLAMATEHKKIAEDLRKKKVVK